MGRSKKKNKKKTKFVNFSYLSEDLSKSVYDGGEEHDWRKEIRKNESGSKESSPKKGDYVLQKDNKENVPENPPKS